MTRLPLLCALFFATVSRGEAPVEPPKQGDARPLKASPAPADAAKAAPVAPVGTAKVVAPVAPADAAKVAPAAPTEPKPEPVAPTAPKLEPLAPISPRPEQGPELDLQKVDQAEYEQQELGLGWALLRTVLVLGAVIALAYLTLNVGLRKLLGIRPQPLGRNLVTVLERIPLDQKRALFVVKAANEVLLIGGSDGSLELITKLDPAEVEKVRALAAATPALQLSPFLQKLLGRKDAPPPPASS